MIQAAPQWQTRLDDPGGPGPDISNVRQWRYRQDRSRNLLGIGPTPATPSCFFEPRRCPIAEVLSDLESNKQDSPAATGHPRPPPPNLSFSLFSHARQRTALTANGNTAFRRKDTLYKQAPSALEPKHNHTSDGMGIHTRMFDPISRPIVRCHSGTRARASAMRAGPCCM